MPDLESLLKAIKAQQDGHTTADLRDSGSYRLVPAFL